MKIFQSVLEFHQITGLYPSKSDPNASILNIRNSLFFLSMFPMLISTLGVTFFQNVSHFGYAETFYIFITCVSCMVNFLVSFLKLTDLHSFFERIEMLMDTSESITIANLTINNRNKS